MTAPGAVAHRGIQSVLWTSCGLLAVTILAMVLVRQWVRDLQIGATAGPDQAAVKTQWSVFPIFLLLFVAAIATVGWMIRRLVVEARERAPV